MSKGRFRKASITEFKGMDASVSPTKLPMGVGTYDSNGRRDWPFSGSWAPRKTYQRMCTSADGIVKESVGIEAIFQFTPTVSNDSTFLDRGNVNTQVDTSTLIVVTQGGDLKAYNRIEPRI
jgi:hypothetical protein|tara:strand:- start:17767 stop:18129 length:363 start_codon:yes stop_codon:yes gene_type:complete